MMHAGLSPTVHSLKNMQNNKDTCTSTPHHTILADIEGFKDWHKGRARYCVWMYRLDDVGIRQKLTHLAAAISTALGTAPIHHFHVTLFASGFLSTSIRYNDDITPDTISRQIDAAKALTHTQPHLVMTGLEANAYGVFIALEDQSPTTGHIRNALTHISGEVPRDSFMPHITLGNYLQAYPLARVKAMLKTLLVPDFPLTIPHCHLELVTLDATTPLRPDIGLCRDNFTTLYSAQDGQQFRRPIV